MTSGWHIFRGAAGNLRLGLCAACDKIFIIILLCLGLNGANSAYIYSIAGLNRLVKSVRVAAGDEYDKALKGAATTLKRGEYIYKDEFRGLKMEFPGRFRLQKTFEKKLHEASSTTIPNSKHGEEMKAQFENQVTELDLTVKKIRESLQALYSWEGQVQVFWIVVLVTIGVLFYQYGGFS